MNQYAFMVTSAINTKFGVYSADQRLEQTLQTIGSIRQRVPQARIIVVEMGAIELTASQLEAITSASDHVMSFNTDPAVVELFNSTDNWDVVKNVTEVMCFSQALSKLQNHTAELDGIQRIFKVSGRYTLNDGFDIERYQDADVATKIVVGASRPSQFPLQLPLVDRQYMSRLWSWPHCYTDQVIQVYNRGLVYMQERLFAGGYCDIEHMLYKFLDNTLVVEFDQVGIQGNLGPNGVAIKD